MKRTLNPSNPQPTWLNLFLGLWWLWLALGVAIFFYLLGAYFQSPVYQMHQIGGV